MPSEPFSLHVALFPSISAIVLTDGGEMLVTRIRASNAGGTTNVSGTIQYAGTATSVPNTEISSIIVHDSAHNSKGSQSNQASYNFAFTLLTTIANNQYHINVVGTDANFPNGDISGATFNVASDKVNITLTVLDNQIPVGTAATITPTGYYEYDLAVFAGSVTLNDTTTKSSVGRFNYTCLSVAGGAYPQITVCDSNEVYVIFDRVNITTFSAVDTRININDTATFSVVGNFEYNTSEAWTGAYVLNDTVTKASAGTFVFNITSITDPT